MSKAYGSPKPSGMSRRPYRIGYLAITIAWHVASVWLAAELGARFLRIIFLENAARLPSQNIRLARIQVCGEKCFVIPDAVRTMAALTESRSVPKGSFVSAATFALWRCAV